MSSVTISAPKQLGLSTQVAHQVGPHDAFGKTGKVLDVGGVHQRTAGLDGALEDQRVQVGPRRVDSRGA